MSKSYRITLTQLLADIDHSMFFLFEDTDRLVTDTDIGAIHTEVLRVIARVQEMSASE